MRTNALHRTLALTALLALAACGGGKLRSNDGAVRLLNASADFATLDLVSDNSTVVSGVASYGASGYADLNPGSRAFALRVPGSGVDTASLTVSLTKDTHTTLVAYGSGANLGLTSIGEDDDAPPSGKARLRFVNTASVEAGAVDVYVVAASTACGALPDATPAAITGLSLGAGGVVEVSAAGGAGTSYNLCLLATGDKTDLRLALNSVTLKDQQISTLVLTRTAGGVLIDAVQFEQQGSLTVRRNTAARVRVVAALPAGATVTAQANGSDGASATLAAALASPGITDYRLVAAGDLALRINGGAIAASVAAGSNSAVLVRGTTAADISVLTEANAPSTSASKPARLRLLNGTASTATLTLDNAVLADGVAPGGASAAVNVGSSASASTIAVSLGGSATPLQLTAQTLEAGKVYSLFVLNNASGAPQLTLRSAR